MGQLVRLVVLLQVSIAGLSVSHTAFAQDTDLESGATRSGGLPQTESPGAEFESLLTRPVNEDWVLSFQEHYERRGDPLHRHLQTALKQTREAGGPDTGERIADVDNDGVADWWVYFQDGEAVVAETDRLGVGVHDMRFDLRADRAIVHAGWYLEPPVELSSPDHPALRLTDLFDAAGTTEADGEANRRPCTHEELAEHLFPGHQDVLRTHSETAPLSDADRETILQALQTYEKHRERFADEYRQRRSTLVTQIGRVRRETSLWLDLDDVEGSESSLTISETGPAAAQFFEEDQADPDQFLFGIVLHDGEVVRIETQDRRFLRIGSWWARVSDASPRLITEQLLEPGFAAWEAGRWYEATELMRSGVVRIAMCGDISHDAEGKLRGDVTSAKTSLTGRILGSSQVVNSRWDVSVRDQSAVPLAMIALSISWLRSEWDGMEELAEDAFERKRFARAAELYSRVIELSVKINKTQPQVRALERRSRAHARLGRLDLALSDLLQSLDLESSLGYAVDVADNVSGLASGNERGSALRDAVDMRSHAMAVNRACKLAQVAALNLELGEDVKAEGLLAEAQRIFTSTGHTYGQADILNLQARIALNRGRTDRALSLAVRAMEAIEAAESDRVQLEERKDLHQAVRDKALHEFVIDRGYRDYIVIFMASQSNPLAFKAVTAGLLGDVLTEISRTRKETAPEQAREALGEAAVWHNKAVAWFDEAGDEPGRIVSYVRLASVALEQGNTAEAISKSHAAADLAEELGLLPVRWQALALEGSALWKQGKLREAAERLEVAADEIESVRNSLSSEAVRRGFFASKLDVYGQLALVYAQLELEEDVWRCIERSKARTLLDLLAGQDMSLRGDDVQKVRRDVPLLFQGGASLLGGAEGSEEVETQIQNLLERSADRHESAEILSLHTVTPESLKSVQSELPDGHVMIEYFQAPDRLLAAVVSQKSLRIVNVAEVDSAGLDALVDEFLDVLGDGHVEKPDAAYAARYRRVAGRLHKQLVAPCLKGTQDVTHLVFVPAGRLHYVPFSALVNEQNRFLVEDFFISTVSSGSALVYANRRRQKLLEGSASPRLLVALSQPVHGFAPLPFAVAASELIAQQKDAQPAVTLFDVRASESAVRQLLPSAGLFQFDGHAELDVSAPLQSALLLNTDPDSDGRLEVREVFGMQLPKCRLAVLSGCNTNRGRLGRGDELTSLSRAFLRAGVPTVVATLWSVRDRETAQLMVRFHERLGSSEGPPQEALTLAQRDFLKDGLQEIDLPKPEDRMLTMDVRGNIRRLRTGATASDEESEPAVAFSHPQLWAGFVTIGASR